MTTPYHVTAKYILDKGTLEDNSETEALIKRRLDYFYYCIETIKLDLGGFKKLSVNCGFLGSEKALKSPKIPKNDLPIDKSFFVNS